MSLGSPTKIVNGSALRYEQKPAPNVEDPSKVLREILRLADEEDSAEKQEQVIVTGLTEEDVNIDFGGLSLEEFAAQDDLEEKRPLEEPVLVETSRKKFENFHKSIVDSDEVLNSVESYLTNFKAELGQVSAEIESLQDRSVQLNARLENRRQVEKLLGPAVEDVSVSPMTVRAIAEGPIDDNFVRALNEVEARSAKLDSKQGSQSVKALEDVKPLLNDLKARATERIRDYVVAQIKSIRSPNINAQVIQAQNLLRHKDLFPFLARIHPTLAEEIGQAYTNTMKWYYTSNFTRYQQALEKLPLHTYDTTDLIGTDPTPKRTTIGKSAVHHPDPFSIAKRADILQSLNSPALPSHLATDTPTATHLEVPFRHFNRALLDNATFEYSLTTTIYPTTTSFAALSRKALSALDPAFTLGHNLTTQLISKTTDCLGILLCVRLNQSFAFELQRRKLPIADNYINYTNILLWPRFQQVMDLHCDSLKKVPIPSASRGAAAAFSLVGGGADTSKASMAPHPVTQRFGQFLHGILSLSRDAGDDEPLSKSLGRLRTEYVALMGKLAKAAGGGDALKRARFLGNNYSLVMTIIGEVKGRLAEEQREFFGGLLAEGRGR